MKSQFKIIMALLFIISAGGSFANTESDVMAKYYSRLISYNMNHIMDLTRSLYHLTEEPSFKKEYLESEINRLKEIVEDTNDEIAEMKKYISVEHVKKIQIYLDNIDQHLAQVYLDIKTLRGKLTDDINIPNLVSDIYYQVKIAENEDHLEIKKIQNYTNEHLAEVPKSER